MLTGSFCSRKEGITALQLQQVSLARNKALMSEHYDTLPLQMA